MEAAEQRVALCREMPAAIGTFTGEQP